MAAALINSANDVYFQNVLIAEPNRACGRRAKAQNVNAALGSDRQPDTLAERLLQEQWPKGHRYRSFTNWKNLLELRFTHNDEFNHELSKDKKSGKLHCTLCVVGKTMYRCNVCKVSLCKTPKTKSHNDKTCFTIWHSSVDLIVENKKIKAALRKKSNLDERLTNDNNTEEDNESSDNGDEETHSDKEGDNDHSEPTKGEKDEGTTNAAEGEEEGKTSDTDGNNDEEEDAEGERVHRYSTMPT